MIWFAIAFLLLGMALSAFFSGSETGFYRANRMRVVMDTLDGDWISAGLFWLTNRPAFFVATTLIGNNLANQITSKAVTFGSGLLLEDATREVGQLLANLLFTPVLFILGELLPKQLFYKAPNRLLRWSAPLFLLCCVLFAPLAIVLWGLGRILEKLAGEKAPRTELMIARRELEQILEEGHESGILRTKQRQLTQGLLLFANRPVSEFSIPLNKYLRVPANMTTSEVQALAQQLAISTVLLEDADQPLNLLGYVQMIDLGLAESEDLQDCLQPLLEISAKTSLLAALLKLHKFNHQMAKVTNAKGQPIGVITKRLLILPLFQGTV